MLEWWLEQIIVKRADQKQARPIQGLVGRAAKLDAVGPAKTEQHLGEEVLRLVFPTALLLVTLLTAGCSPEPSEQLL